MEELISFAEEEKLKQLFQSSKFNSTISADLSLIKKEIELLNLFAERIAENSRDKMNSSPVSGKNISNLIIAFNEFMGQRKRIIFKIRSKQGLIAGKPEYEQFMIKMMGGESKSAKQDPNSDKSGYEIREYLGKNLFHQLNQLIVELDEIVSAS